VKITAFFSYVASYAEVYMNLLTPFSMQAFKRAVVPRSISSGLFLVTSNHVGDARWYTWVTLIVAALHDSLSARSAVNTSKFL
jgi:hypothetical protein